MPGNHQSSFLLRRCHCAFFFFPYLALISSKVTSLVGTPSAAAITFFFFFFNIIWDIEALVVITSPASPL